MDKEYVSPKGRLDYWESTYNEEVNQFHNNPTQTGDVWFGNNVQSKVLDYISKTFLNRDISILDIGFGNGIFLYKLSKLNFTNLHGSDYSIESLKFATEIIGYKAKKHSKPIIIDFYQEDINNKSSANVTKYTLIHDKGTFDAFMLLPGNKVDSYQQYIHSYSMNDNSTTFIITSCNNTKGELLEKFTKEKGFEYIDEIPYKKFQFGGSEGQSVTTLIFKIYTNNTI